jgi:hypothetical protein
VAEIGGEPTVIASATSGSLGLYAPDGTLIRTMQQGSSLNLFESASVGDVRGDGTRSLVKYEIGIEQAANLLLVGQNVPYSHYIGSWNADSGAPNPGYPTITDDYQFLSSSTIAKVNPLGPTNQILAGTGLGLLHAYDGVSGVDAPGFPKVTGGWMFAPAELSDDGRMAGITREGFLFEWDTDAPPCQPPSQWPTFRHDPMGSGNLDRDGTAPGAPGQLKLETLGGDRYRVSFVSPGDDRMCGTPEAYIARIDGNEVNLGAPVAGGQQFSHEFTLPSGTLGSAVLSIQARDDAGGDIDDADGDNLGFPARARINEAAPGEPSPPGNGPGGGPGPGGDGSGPGGSPTGEDLAPCTDRLAPRSAFDRRGARVSSKRVKLFGSSKDRGCPPTGRVGERPGEVARVQVAIARRVRGRCRYMKSSGRFTRRRSCSRRPHFIAAKVRYSPSAGTTRFSFTLRNLDLPAGSYRLTARGIDANGNIEGLRSRSRVATVRLR